MFACSCVSVFVLCLCASVPSRLARCLCACTDVLCAPQGRPVVSAEEVEEAASRASAAVVFVNTIYTAQFISELLQEMGILCVCLHSAMNQRRRIAAIAKFKSSLVHVSCCPCALVGCGSM